MPPAGGHVAPRRVLPPFNGPICYLWRVVDQQGQVLASLGTAQRDEPAAQRSFGQRLKDCRYVPRVISTDKWVSYGATKRESLPGVEHRQHKGLNNRAENSHQPPRHPQQRTYSGR